MDAISGVVDDGIGVEPDLKLVQRGVAAVVIGGMILATFLTLLILPSIYYSWGASPSAGRLEEGEKPRRCELLAQRSIGGPDMLGRSCGAMHEAAR